MEFIAGMIIGAGVFVAGAVVGLRLRDVPSAPIAQIIRPSKAKRVPKSISDAEIIKRESAKPWTDPS